MTKKITAHTLPLQNNRYFQNMVVLTDFNCGIANAQIEMRFRNVFQYVMEQIQTRTTLPKKVGLPTLPKGLVVEAPAVISVHDIPFANVDYAAYALYSCMRALGRSAPNLYVHVTDPGVGDAQDRSILVTDIGNTYIGPNNGSLALLKTYFKQRDIIYETYFIDHEKVEQLEQHRMEEPTYHIPRTFHGRDIFAVVAGFIAGGMHPKILCKSRQSPKVVETTYAKGIQPLPEKLRTPVEACVFRDNTFGNLKTNLTIDALMFDQLVEDKAIFRITHHVEKGLLGKRKSVFEFQAKRVFADLKKSELLLYLGSTFAPAWDDRFVELAVNMGNVSQLLGLPRSYTGAHMLTVERLK